MIFKIAALGLIFSNFDHNPYLYDQWNILDAIIVIVSLV